MKKILLSFLLLSFGALVLPLQASTEVKDFRPEVVKHMLQDNQDMPLTLAQMNAEDFLSLTPKKIKESTGHKLSLKETIALKAAQKSIRKDLAHGDGNSSGPKSQLVALLLVILVGYLGIHRFYLGYTTIGIIQLLTLGGCGIWALIDLIMIITGDLQPADGSSYNPTL